MADTYFIKDDASVVTSNRMLYTPSPFARSCLVYLQEIGELTANQPHTSSRSHLASCLFFMVLSGSGELIYQDVSYPLTVGDCIFIDCRKAYAHRTQEDLWKIRWVHFYGSNAGGIYDKYAERGGRPCFHPANLSAFCDLWEKLFELAGSSDYIRDMKINEGLNALLTLLMNESWHPGSRNADAGQRQKRDVVPVKEYLDVHFSEKIVLDELAELFFINKYYLTRIFKEQFGLSINQYLLQVRITHAKQMLRFTEEKVETIGLKCGLGALTYFSRTFKKVEGVSPGKYREQW